MDNKSTSSKDKKQITPLHYLILSDCMEFKNVITTRQSIRSYTKTPIEEEKLTYILECAQQSPSWANTQCWRFIIIQHTNMIAEIAKASLINRWIKQAPYLIIACADTTESGKKNDLDYYPVDVAIAFEHLILAATDVGLGTCWIGAFDEKKIKTLLHIPTRVKIIAMTPLGYPTSQPSSSDTLRKVLTRRTKRKSLSEIIHYEQW